jgi:hypothetical protein
MEPIMRLFAISLLLFASAFQHPNPNRRTEHSSVNERDSQVKTDNKQTDPSSNAPPQISVHSLVVREPQARPEQHNAYDPRHDSLYRAYLWATILGVAGAVLGIIILIRQTRITRQAANAAKDAADAALLQAKILLKAERAYLMIRVIFSHERYSIDVVNEGRTPGEILSYDRDRDQRRERYIAGNYQYEGRELPDPIVLPHNVSHRIDSWALRDIPHQMMTEIQQRELFLIYHGQVIYRDISGETHTTRYCLLYGPETGLQPHGPKGCNDHT